jgi:hypothetical protein
MIEEIRNPKREIRNKSECSRRKFETGTRLDHSNFGLRACFGFRASDFEFAPAQAFPRQPSKLHGCLLDFVLYRISAGR